MLLIMPKYYHCGLPAAMAWLMVSLAMVDGSMALPGLRGLKAAQTRTATCSAKNLERQE